MIQTSTKLPAPSRDSMAILAINPGARKMPLPIIDPMMIIVASSSLNRRRGFSESGMGRDLSVSPNASIVEPERWWM